TLRSLLTLAPTVCLGATVSTAATIAAAVIADRARKERHARRATSASQLDVNQIVQASHAVTMVVVVNAEAAPRHRCVCVARANARSSQPATTLILLAAVVVMKLSTAGMTASATTSTLHSPISSSARTSSWARSGYRL